MDELELLKETLRIYNSFFILLIVAIFAAAVALLYVLARNVRARKNLKSNTTFLNETVSAQEDERRRISQELHDTVSQNIKVLLLMEKECQEGAQGYEQKERIQKIIDLEKQNQKQLRAIIQNLALPGLKELPFKNTIADLCAQFSNDSGIPCRFYADPQVDLQRFSAQERHHILRIIQEALNNAKSHAKAQETGVMIQKREDKIRVMVYDDGIGIDNDRRSHKQAHFGMSGMEMRAALLGGTLAVHSSKDTGAKICVDLPAGGDGKQAASDSRMGGGNIEECFIAA